jgi:hypothetical protein
MTEEKALYAPTEPIMLGSMMVMNFKEVIADASEIAKELARIAEEQKLYSVIQGRKFMRVEGWTTLGAMLGILPREVSVVEKDGDFESTIELIRAIDGAVIGRGSAIVGQDETTWQKRPRYARRSMSLTRATGKAFRLGFSWIMTLAGFEPTPAEEMDGVFVEVEDTPPPPAVPAMPYEMAKTARNSKEVLYVDLDDETLSNMTIGIGKALNKKNLAQAKREEYQFKLGAIKAILQERDNEERAK